MKILLVEPKYKNKYPPIGLMKISTFHKERGDEVLFYKGLMKAEDFIAGGFERVYVTSLFTFYFDLTVKTVLYYQTMIDANQIYVGGILATLMKEKIVEEIGSKTKVLNGLLTDARVLDFDDNCNIDLLPLDYSLLDDIDYKYPAGDNYFSYITRGCTNKCSFCAVPKLEPTFGLTNNIIEQIHEATIQYGAKQNLLLMDNNILSLSVEDLQNVVNDLILLGFGRNSPKFIPQLPFDIFMAKLNNRRYSKTAHSNILGELTAYLFDKKKTKMVPVYREKYDEILKELNENEDKEVIIRQQEQILREILAYYHRPAGRKRYVDFNQGIDARQLTDEKMKVLSALNIEPFRLAFDKKSYEKIYTKALRIAARHEVKEFSNYLLYNCDDTPEDLWWRLKINIDLVKEYDRQIRIFSFPMKYAPINKTDRLYIGKHWKKKYLSNIQAVINVTKGIVADGENFFYRAFGKTIQEFYEILAMPRELVIYRKYFEENGTTAQWRECYHSLTEEEKEEYFLCFENASETKNEKVNAMLAFDKIKKPANEEDIHA